MLLCVCFSRPFKDSKLKKSAHLNFILLLLVFPSSFGLSIPSCLITVVFSHPPGPFHLIPCFYFPSNSPWWKSVTVFFFSYPLKLPSIPFCFTSLASLSLSLLYSFLNRPLLSLPPSLSSRRGNHIMSWQSHPWWV